MSKRIYYNCHTHVFSKSCIPNSILGNGWSFLIRLLDYFQMNNFALFFIKIFNVLPITRDSAPRLKMFFRSFAQGRQEHVIEHLIKNEYDLFAPEKNFKFVLLTLDLDTQSDKIPDINFANQIEEIAEYKRYKTFKDRIIPFMSINPYNPIYRQVPLVTLVKNYVEHKGFAGIKLYPASGYYVDDSRMDEVWQYCEDQRLPIMSHCTCGRVYFQGNMSTRMMPNKMPYPYLKGSDLQCNFTDMAFFSNILQRHPTLKICFAHCGGVVFSKTPKAQLERELQKNEALSVRAIEYQWYKQILEWCHSDKYPNIYMDISWINHDKVTLQQVYDDVVENEIMHKVLYGTDFFVNMDRITEKDALHFSAGTFDLDIIASKNAANYLNSNKHKIKDTE